MNNCVSILVDYSYCKSVSGYKGWNNKYVVKNVRYLDGTLICKDYEFGNLKSLKGKGYKKGDTLKMTVNISISSRGKVIISRPLNIIKYTNN